MRLARSGTSNVGALPRALKTQRHFDGFVAIEVNALCKFHTLVDKLPVSLIRPKSVDTWRDIDTSPVGLLIKASPRFWHQ